MLVGNEECEESCSAPENEGLEDVCAGPSCIVLESRIDTNWKQVDNFDDMNLKEELLRGIHACGFLKPSSIQKKAIIPCIKGNDVIALAPSVSGRTAAFLISILQKIDSSNRNCQALILAPNAKLARKMQKLIITLSKFMSVDCHDVSHGGRRSDRANYIKNLKGGLHVIIGTPERVSFMLTRKSLLTSHIKIFVLDEAVKMFSQQFKDQIHNIFKTLNSDVQVIFSARITKDVNVEKSKVEKEQHLKNKLKEMEQREITLKQKCFKQAEKDKTMKNQTFSLKSELEELKNVKKNMIASIEVLTFKNVCDKNQMMVPESKSSVDKNREDVCIKILHTEGFGHDARNEDGDETDSAPEKKRFKIINGQPSGMDPVSDIETNWNQVVDSFYDVNLKKELLKSIHAYGFERPSAIQQRAIMPCISGRDVILLAPCGTGKASTFSISILQQIETSNRNCQALILAPTRKLAEQIQTVVVALSYFMRVVCKSCTGEISVWEDSKKLKGQSHVIVGTPGGVFDLIERKVLDTHHIKIFVLYEADEMLSESSFKRKIHNIFERLNSDVQVIFSATMPKDETNVSTSKKKKRKLQLQSAKKDEIRQNQTASLISELKDLKNVKKYMSNPTEELIVENCFHKGRVIIPDRETSLDKSKEHVFIRIPHNREDIERNGRIENMDKNTTPPEWVWSNCPSRRPTGMDIETNCNDVVDNFENLNLNVELLRGIYAYGFEKPSAIQQRAIIPCIRGHDVIAQAPPSTGKTTALSISVLQQIDTSNRDCQALILAPTRELAQHIQRVLITLSNFMGVVVHMCNGGTKLRENVKQLADRPHLVIGTPGRVLDMITRRALLTNRIKIFVLDDADKLLSERSGFRDQIHNVFRKLNSDVQVILFSDTVSQDVLDIQKNANPRLTQRRKELEVVERKIITLKQKIYEEDKRVEMLKNPMLSLTSELKQLKPMNKNQLTSIELRTVENLRQKHQRKIFEGAGSLNGNVVKNPFKYKENVNLTNSQMEEIEKKLYNKLYSELKKNLLIEIMEELKNGTIDLASLTKTDSFQKKYANDETQRLETDINKLYNVETENEDQPKHETASAIDK